MNAITWVIPKARSNYRNLQYAFMHFRSKVDMEAAKNGDLINFDNRKLI